VSDGERSDGADGAGPRPDDEALVGALRRAVSAADPLPEAWYARALDCAEWLATDAVQADLAYESAGGVGEEARLPHLATAPCRATYVAPGCTVELELSEGPDGLHVVGRLHPPERRPVRALWLRGSQPTESDGSGRFRFDGLPLGAVSFLVGGATPVKTGWNLPC
jgi:hypothetical protein